MRKWIAAAVMAATVGGAAVGAALLNVPVLAGAQSTTTAPAEPRTAPPWMTDALKKLVDAGTINQSQADAVSQALVAAKPEGKPHGGPRGPKGPRLEVIAGAIGIDEAALRTELKAGKTIAEVAQAHGVDVQKVVDALVAELKAHLDADVAAGRLTQAQADERLAKAPARITEMLNHKPPAPGEGHGPGGRGLGGPGFGPDDEPPVSPPTTTG
ncbi:MAG TPA: hypothetical protein VM121_09580 [Acidimicrobiales bacterium]|nr:hypothetical protein [Acidimicrobiales bacterium]